MILLNEVAQKIEDILNGSDEEIIRMGLQPPTGYYFKVATEGFHLDSIANIPESKNFIPVFLSSMGGQFNPVPELLQANYVIPIAIYFPVRFKDDMYRINEYLAKALVGRFLSYGVESGKALSNISVAQFSEIIELDLKSFLTWAETTYRKKIETMEPYIQMTISLYLSTASQEYVYGNDATATLTVVTDDEEWAEEDRTDELSFVQQSIQSHSDPNVQQLIGSDETEGLPSGTSYASSFAVYVKNTNFYANLIEKWFDGKAQTLTLNLELKFLNKTFTRTVYIQSTNLALQKGELATITFSFAKKVVFE